MKYIDAEKLKAEIERLKSVLTDPLCNQGNILGPDWVAGGNKMLNEISSVITTLQQEQPEVDLEDVIENYILENFGERWDGCVPVGCFELDLMAKHFYGLGLNARKED